MESRLKFFHLVVLITIFLNALLLFPNYFLITGKIVTWKTDLFFMLFILSFIIFLINSIVVLLLLKKYPAQFVSNKFEGFVYLFAILTFLFALIDMLHIYAFTYIAFDLKIKGDNPLTPILMFAAISTTIATILAIFIAINSFRLLKTIKRNYWTLAHQIKNIGTDYE